MTSSFFLCIPNHLNIAKLPQQLSNHYGIDGIAFTVLKQNITH